MLKKLDRYLLSEFWLPLVSGAGIITGVWLGIDKFKDIFKLLAKSGTSLTTGLVILGLEIPQILAITLPIGVLIATFLSFQKLSGLSELLALRAAGVSFTRLMLPVVILGLLACLLGFAISEFIVPITRPFAKKMYTFALYQTPIPTKSVKSFSYQEKDTNGVIKRIFYVRKFKDGFLKDILILDCSQKNLWQIYTASKGQWLPEKGGWMLINGSSSYIKSPNKNAQNKNAENLHLVSQFDSTFIPSSFNPQLILKNLEGLSDMNFVKLKEFINLHGKTLETEKLSDAMTKFHSKFAYPFSCIILAIIGSCLGIVGRRKVINWGYIAIGLVVFLFYMSQTIFDSYGNSGKIDPMLAAWMPNLLLGSLAVLCFWYRAEQK
jgi:lipopolysaccharide export system permease protein